MYQAWWAFPLLFSMTLGAGVRRHRLRSGGKANPRDAVLIMGCARAVGWLCLGVAAWADRSRHVPRSDALAGLLRLAGVAFGPPGLFLAAVWLQRLFRDAAGKKPAAPHPLD